MRLTSILVAVIILFMLFLSYFKMTKSTLDESMKVPGAAHSGIEQTNKDDKSTNVWGTTDTRIKQAHKAVEDLNKATLKQKKAVEKLME